MDTRLMYDLEDNLCKDLEPYSKKGSLTRNDLETVFYLTGAIKNLEKISMMEEEGYSYGNGEWNASGNYSNRGHGRLNDGRYSGRRNSYDVSDYSERRRGSYGYDSNDMPMYEERMRRMMDDTRM